jgi:hypothetical protein
VARGRREQVACAARPIQRQPFSASPVQSILIPAACTSFFPAPVPPSQADWDSFVAGVQFAYNSSVHASTGFAPFVLTTGRIPSFPEEGVRTRLEDHPTCELLLIWNAFCLFG